MKGNDNAGNNGAPSRATHPAVDSHTHTHNARHDSGSSSNSDDDDDNGSSCHKDEHDGDDDDDGGRSNRNGRDNNDARIDDGGKHGGENGTRSLKERELGDDTSQSVQHTNCTTQKQHQSDESDDLVQQPARRRSRRVDSEIIIPE